MDDATHPAFVVMLFISAGLLILWALFWLRTIRVFWRGPTKGVLWGSSNENSAWISDESTTSVMYVCKNQRTRSTYLAMGRFRLRLGTPHNPETCDFCRKNRGTYFGR